MVEVATQEHGELESIGEILAAGSPASAVDLQTLTDPVVLGGPAPGSTAARGRTTRLALLGADVTSMVGMAGLLVLLVGGAHAWPTLAAFALVTLALVQLSGLYAREAAVVQTSLLDEFPALARTVTLAVALCIIVIPEAFAVSDGLLTTLWVLGCVAIPVNRMAARAIVRGRTRDERVLVLGSGRIADLVASKVSKHPELGLQIIGCLDIVGDAEPVLPSELPHLGTLPDVERIVAEREVDAVIIAFSAVPHEDLLDAIRRCKRMGLKISVVPRLFEVIGSRIELHDIEGLTLLGLRGADRSRGALAAKRAMDIIGSALALVLLAPLLAAVAVVVRGTSRGPVLFRQERIGRGQRPFRMLKFRTMEEGADERKHEVLHLNEMAAGPMFKIARDPRVTGAGRFLRATSLDEFPQFWNVLRGEMSIVGPRPLIREENDAVLGWHRTRLDLTPGLTGPWQVLGRQHVPFDEMVRLDYLYVAEWSFWNDIKLALRTVPVVLRRTGA